jgi:hypothetical protein
MKNVHFSAVQNHPYPNSPTRLMTPTKSLYSATSLATVINNPDLQTAYTDNDNSVALVRERTILTEQPPLEGEVSANFCG